MSPELWARVEAVFDAVVETEPEERAAVLARMSGDDEAVRAEVESLLAADEAADGYLAGSAETFLVASDAASQDQTATRTALSDPAPWSSPPPRAEGSSPSAAERKPRSSLRLAALASSLLVALLFGAALAWIGAAHLSTSDPPTQAEMLMSAITDASRGASTGDFKLGHLASARTHVGDSVATSSSYGLAFARCNAALALGDFEAARVQLRRAFIMSQQSAAPRPLERAVGLSCLGNLLHAQDRLDDAASAHRRALEIRRRELAAPHPDIASSLNSLGVVLDAQGDAESIKMLQEAAVMYVDVHGDAHPSVASVLSNMAAAYQRRGELDQAARYYRRAIGILNRAVGPQHPFTLTSRSNLATLMQEQGLLQQARAIHQDVLAKRRVLYPDDHPQLAASRHKLAGLLQEAGETRTAEAHYDTTLWAYQSALPEDHEWVVRLRREYAHLLEQSGRPREAATILDGPDADDDGYPPRSKDALSPLVASYRDW